VKQLHNFTFRGDITSVVEAGLLDLDACRFDDWKKVPKHILPKWW